MSKVGLQLQIKFNFILFTNHCVYVTIINLFFAHPVCDFFLSKDINVWMSMVMMMIYTNKLFSAY